MSKSTCYGAAEPANPQGRRGSDSPVMTFLHQEPKCLYLCQSGTRAPPAPSAHDPTGSLMEIYGNLLRCGTCGATHQTTKHVL